MFEADTREVNGHKKNEDVRSTTKTHEDNDFGDENVVHEICVISWNINKSSARHDFLRDVAQCQIGCSHVSGDPKLG